jgi:hypothetical protein
MSAGASSPSSPARPLRHRLLLGAAFATALATGYVARLDGAALADSDAGLELVAVRTRTTPPGAAPSGRPSSLARGSWPTPSAEALQAWGQALEGGGGRDERAASGRVRAVAVASAAKAPALAGAAAAPASAAAAVPPPAWRFIGRIDDGGPVRAMLATAQQLHVVAERDTLDGRWRVERIAAQAVQLRALAGDAVATLAWEAP